MNEKRNRNIVIPKLNLFDKNTEKEETKNTISKSIGNRNKNSMAINSIMKNGSRNSSSKRESITIFDKLLDKSKLLNFNFLRKYF